MLVFSEVQAFAESWLDDQAALYTLWRDEPDRARCVEETTAFNARYFAPPARFEPPSVVRRPFDDAQRSLAFYLQRTLFKLEMYEHRTYGRLVAAYTSSDKIPGFSYAWRAWISMWDGASKIIGYQSGCHDCHATGLLGSKACRECSGRGWRHRGGPYGVRVREVGTLVEVARFRSPADPASLAAHTGVGPVDTEAAAIAPPETDDLNPSWVEQMCRDRLTKWWPGGRGRDDRSPERWLERRWNAAIPAEQGVLAVALGRLLLDDDPRIQSGAIHFFASSRSIDDTGALISALSQHPERFESPDPWREDDWDLRTVLARVVGARLRTPDPAVMPLLRREFARPANRMAMASCMMRLEPELVERSYEEIVSDSPSFLRTMLFLSLKNQRSVELVVEAGFSAVGGADVRSAIEQELRGEQLRRAMAHLSAL